MKTPISNYTFDKDAHTITFNDYTKLSLDGLLLITNVTDNIILYNFADPANGASISGNVVTLGYNTSSMSNTDALQIFYDDASKPVSDESIIILRRIAKLLESSGTVDVNGRQRVASESTVISSGTLTTCTTCTTCASVTNIAGFGGVDPKFQFVDIARNAYNNGIRNKLSFT